jgi:hypothetical protein
MSAEWKRATKLRLSAPSARSLPPDHVLLPLAFSKFLEETARAVNGNYDDKTPEQICLVVAEPVI